MKTHWLPLIFAVAWVSPQVEAAPSHDGEVSISAFLRSYMKHGTAYPDQTLRYITVPVSLSANSIEQVVVYLKGQSVCGSGGCTMLVITPSQSSYRVVSKTLIVNAPVRVLDSITNGWHDLEVTVRGGGIFPGHEAKLRFDGKRYLFNPSIPPTQELSPQNTGHEIISADDEGQALYERLPSSFDREIEAHSDRSLMEAANKACPSGWQMNKRLDETHWQIWCITDETWPHPKKQP